MRFLKVFIEIAGMMRHVGLIVGNDYSQDRSL